MRPNQLLPIGCRVRLLCDSVESFHNVKALKGTTGIIIGIDGRRYRQKIEPDTIVYEIVWDDRDQRMSPYSGPVSALEKGIVWRMAYKNVEDLGDATSEEILTHWSIRVRKLSLFV